MNQPTDPNTAEAKRFCGYVSGTTPTDYVVGKYLNAHEVCEAFEPHSRFDRWLVAFARLSSATTSLADSFARLFLPRSVLLRKLTLALAIVETSPTIHRTVDAPLAGNAAFVASVVGIHAILGAITALAATLLLGPVWALAKLLDRLP